MTTREATQAPVEPPHGRQQASSGSEASASGFDALLPAASTAPALLSLLPELKLVIALMTGALIIAALYFGRIILVPLALAFLFGFVLDPLVVRLRRWGLPRAPAVVMVVGMCLVVLALGGLFLGMQVSALSSQLPTYQSNIRLKMRDLRESVDRPGMFDGAMKTIDTVKHEVEKASPPAKKSEGPPPPQRVQVEPRQPTPFEQAARVIEAGSGPLVNLGIVLVFVVLILLDRLDLRDRLVRLLGGSLHRSTDAMDEASRRISRYLTMQLVVNLTYGVPMAAGLWLIGVPGAILWGAVAAVMRFVPYLGPVISAAFPITLAVAVDPGWSMVLWTISLIVVLELVSNNIIEPWLYGHSTGLSAMSLIVAATFWTALWGPVGLIMSTPLTVCLLVFGRHLPRLRFLDVLLGSQPVLDLRTRLYQRLIAGDIDEASELAVEQVTDDNPTAFYAETGLGVLRMASSDHSSVATAEHRHRVVTGMDALIDEMQEQFPANSAAGAPVQVVCIGGKWEIDGLAARMCAHALSLAGHPSTHRPPAVVTADHVAGLDLDGVQCVCLSYFSPEPQVAARGFCRRLRRRWPQLKVVLGLWNAAPPAAEAGDADLLGADAVVGSVDEAVVRIAELLGEQLSDSVLEAIVPEEDVERLAALDASGARDPRARLLFDAAAQRAADIFDMPLAMVSLIEKDTQTVAGAHGALRSTEAGHAVRARGDDLAMSRASSLCGHVVTSMRTMVVPDVTKDLRFAGNKALRAKGIRFYAGAPLRDSAGFVLGTLCLLDQEPRQLDRRETRLLEAMADDLMKGLSQSAAQWGDLLPTGQASDDPPSATVGQAVPAN